MMMDTNAMNHKKDMVAPKDIKGELTYDDKVIEKIVGIALEKVDGLLTVDGGFFSSIADKLVNNDDVTSGVDVEVGKKQVATDLNIVVEYGIDIANLYDKMKKLITEEVKKMTGLDVIEVNVNVTDIKTKEQYDKDSVTLQDRVSDVASSTSKFTSKQTEKAKEAIGKGTSKVQDSMKNNAEPRVE